jgi:ribonuclease J
MVKNETVLTFYGGVNEIGGNKVLIKDGETKVFFDFGMSFALRKQYYSPPFLSPKSEKSLQELGILPKLDGIYRFDEKTAGGGRHLHLPRPHGSFSLPFLCEEGNPRILR